MLRPCSTPAHPSAPPGSERRYEVMQVLGAGGMGEVALAEDHDIQRKVALKRLRPDARSEPALARFAEEVGIIGQLEHPNITPVHDVGIDEEGQHYFVMKYVDGETLESIIDKLAAGAPGYAERFGTDERVEIFVGILNAVRYAHARGVVHRDLKPANIMVGRYSEVTVVDWGIAKKRDSAEAGSGLDGTPLYMSPEQAAGDLAAVGERSDIYRPVRDQARARPQQRAGRICGADLARAAARSSAPLRKRRRAGAGAQRRARGQGPGELPHDAHQARRRRRSLARQRAQAKRFRDPVAVFGRPADNAWSTYTTDEELSFYVCQL